MAPAHRPSLREDNKARTRRRILDALVALVTERGTLDFTVAEVADRAEVPLRTLYRYFPRRQDLVDGLAAEADQVAAITLPDDRDGYEDWLVAAWGNLIAHEVFIRAQHQGDAGVEVRRARIPFYRAVVGELLERDAPQMTQERRDDLIEACLLLSSSAALFEMTDVLGLTPERAARIAARSIVTLLRHP